MEGNVVSHVFVPYVSIVTPMILNVLVPYVTSSIWVFFTCSHNHGVMSQALLHRMEGIRLWYHCDILGSGYQLLTLGFVTADLMHWGLSLCSKGFWMCFVVFNSFIQCMQIYLEPYNSTILLSKITDNIR